MTLFKFFQNQVKLIKILPQKHTLVKQNNNYQALYTGFAGNDEDHVSCQEKKLFKATFCGSKQ